MSSLAALCTVALLTAGQVTSSGATRANHLTRCVVTPIDEAQVPAQDSGLLVAIDANVGMQVRAGARLARLDDQDSRMKLEIARLRLDVAREEADSDVRVRAAQAEAEVAESVYLQGDDATKQRAGELTEADLRRLLLSPRRAKSQTESAMLDLKIAKLNSIVREAEVAAAKQEVDRREIVSPLDGVVIEVYKNVGEWVDPGKPIALVVRMDRLRVEGFVRADDYLPAEVRGRDVAVTVHLSRGKTHNFNSKIAFASPVVEANGYYRVFADVENRQTNGGWLVRPGLKAEMTIDVER